MKIITVRLKEIPQASYFWGSTGWTTNPAHARPSSEEDLVRVKRMLGAGSRFTEPELVETDIELVK